MFWRRRKEREQDLDRELRSHLEAEADEQREAGISSLEACYAARRALGNATRVKEEVRAMWGWTSVEQFRRDVRYACRELRRSPGFTSIAVLTLALGIGAVTAVFSAVDATLLRPLPYSNPESITEIARLSPRYDHPVPISGADFLDWRGRSRSFANMAAYSLTNLTGMSSSGPERIPACKVSASFFSVLGVKPLLGRAFEPMEDRPGKNHEALLGYGIWQTRFGGDAGIIGQTAFLDGQEYVIIGVLPQNFRFEDASDSQVWVPLSLKDGVDRGDHWLRAIGRLAPGSTLKQAQTELDVIAQQLEKEYPKDDGGQGIIAIPFQAWLSRGDIRHLVLTFLTMVGLVLLIVCANLAGLLLARGTNKAKSIAMRAALGASRVRLIRESVIESTTLSVFGGSAAVAFAWILTSLFRTQSYVYLPRADSVVIDGRILFFTLMLSVATGVLFGLVPAIQISKADVNAVLKTGSTENNKQRRWSLQSTIVVAEVALSLVLLIAAGLLTRSMIRALRTNPGYTTSHLLTFWLTAPQNRYPNDRTLTNLSERVLNQIASVPGVRSVALTTALPPSGWEDDGGFLILKHPSIDIKHAPETIVDAISPNYFSTLQIPLIEGRALTERDNRPDATKVVVISRSLANAYFKGENPIGQPMRFEEDDQKNIWTVAGVAGDTRFFGWDHDDGIVTYFPYLALGGRSHFAVAVRTLADPQSIAPTVKRAVWSVDKELPLLDTATMQKRLDEAFAPRRFNAAILGAFACIAMMLASMGIFGLFAYIVSQKTREFRIRMAIGARRKDVLGFVLGRALVLVVVGIGCGLPCSLAGAQLMRGMLYETAPFDIPVFVISAALMLFGALGAAYIPAKRAATVDPMVALRHE